MNPCRLQIAHVCVGECLGVIDLGPEVFSTNLCDILHLPKWSELHVHVFCIATKLCILSMRIKRRWVPVTSTKNLHSCRGAGLSMLLRHWRRIGGVLEAFLTAANTISGQRLRRVTWFKRQGWSVTLTVTQRAGWLELQWNLVILLQWQWHLQHNYTVCTIMKWDLATVRTPPMLSVTDEVTRSRVPGWRACPSPRRASTFCGVCVIVLFNHYTVPWLQCAGLLDIQ